MLTTNELPKLTWQETPGWLDFQTVLDRFVAEADPRDNFIELGSWLGKSSIYWSQKIQQSGKHCLLFCVDTWEGSVSEKPHLEWLKKNGGPEQLYAAFLRNIELAGVGHIILPFRGKTHDRAVNFNDEGFFAVFVDASHDYGDVLQDLQLYWPKVKPGGYLGGHDCRSVWPGVDRALKDFLQEKKLKAQFIHTSFIIKKEV